MVKSAPFGVSSLLSEKIHLTGLQSEVYTLGVQAKDKPTAPTREKNPSQLKTPSTTVHNMP